MKEIFITAVLCLYLSCDIFAQSNCSSPLPISICPTVYLPGQTNAGMGDDASSSCNITGEDVVYEISAPLSTQKIFVSIINTSGPLKVFLEQGSCGTGPCTSYLVSTGSSSLSFTVSNNNYYYLWVDAAATVTYDLSVGGDTGSVWVNIPDTQGNLGFDNNFCGTPAFQNNKKFLQVSYNGVFKTNPMTLSPLNVPGNLCVTNFFKNTTGVEGIKRFIFHFTPGGFSNISAPSSIPGFYNSGNWLMSNIGNDWFFTFVDAAGIGRGDFTGMPNTCLLYKFCFTVTPLTNNQQLTNVSIEMFTDGYGLGFTGLVGSGCCPSGFSNCIWTGSGGGGSGVNGFATSFADPGSPLPVQWLHFDAQLKKNKVFLEWTTAEEINNNYFTIERSGAGYDWVPLMKINGAGNSNVVLNYNETDDHPLSGISFYRLKQTDFDGKSAYSDIKKIQYADPAKIRIYPNPVADLLNMEDGEGDLLELTVYSVLGEKIQLPYVIESDKMVADVSKLSSGIYMIVIHNGDEIIKQEKVIVRR